MSKYARKEQVLEYIKGKKVCSIDELLDKFSVSVSTIHRDLNTLEREGRINKFYGKVTIKEESELYNSRIKLNVELKQRIAGKALQFVRNGDCIFLDNSTTAYYLADALCQSSIRNLLVVSNSALMIELFLNNNNIDFVSTGGKLHKDFNSFVGPQALKSIDDFNGTFFFFSTLSISLDGGISDVFSPDEIGVKKRMFENAKRSILLVDSTKFGKSSTVKCFDLQDVELIITDSSMNLPIIEEFQKIGVKLITA